MGHVGHLEKKRLPRNKQTWTFLVLSTLNVYQISIIYKPFQYYLGIVIDEVWWSVAPALASWCSLWSPRNRTVASPDVAGGSVTVKDRPVHLEQYNMSIADILHLVVICDKWKGTRIVIDRDKIYKQTKKIESAELTRMQRKS